MTEPRARRVAVLYGGPADGGEVALKSAWVPRRLRVELPLRTDPKYLEDGEELAALSVLEAVYQVADPHLPELSPKGVFLYRFEWEPEG